MEKVNQESDYRKLIGQFIEDQYNQERLANLEDYVEVSGQELQIVEQDVAYRNGCWVVYLIYIDLENPHSFIRIPVKTCKTRKLAEITGAYLRRTRSMDSALAFGISEDELDCSLN